MNDETIKKAFENMTPPEELVERVLSFETDKNAAPVNHRRSGRKIYGSMAAVIAAAVCGIGGAAAAGIIDFREVFGEYIRADDGELADSLAGSARDFNYKVSDEAYKIELKGVTGTEKSIIAIAEISRVDGESVTDHFANPTDEKLLDNLWYNRTVTNTLGGGGSGGCYINDKGNIEIYNDFSGSSILTGKTVSVEGENFYPMAAYWDFRQENEVGYFRWRDFSGYVDASEGRYGSDNYIPAPVDDSVVMSLDLEWEFSFKYQPSDNALKTVSNISSEGFPYYQDIYEMEENDSGSYESQEGSLTVAENMVQNVHIEIGSVGGVLEFEYPVNEYEAANNFSPMTYSILKSKHNDFYLIMKDGSTMPVWIDGSRGSTLNGLYECSMNVHYGSVEEMKEIVDVDKVESISLSGVVYELKAS